MNKIQRQLIILFLVFLPKIALCQWIFITDGNMSTVYIEKSSIKKSGNYIKVWTLYDIKKRDEEGYLALKSYAEYDCLNQQVRHLSEIQYSENMSSGFGQTLRSYNTKDKSWAPISPDSVGNDILKVVCSK